MPGETPPGLQFVRSVPSGQLSHRWHVPGEDLVQPSVTSGYLQRRQIAAEAYGIDPTAGIGTPLKKEQRIDVSDTHSVALHLMEGSWVQGLGWRVLPHVGSCPVRFADRCMYFRGTH